MAQCKTCGKSLPKNAQFCGFCGSKALSSCPQCGNTDLPGPNFCIRCGAALKEGLAPATGSRPGASSEEALDAELKVYKASWEDGHHVITCSHCNAKNRIPTARLQSSPTCGRCRQPLPTP